MITLTEVNGKAEFKILTGSTRYDDRYFYFPRKCFDVLIKDKNVFITSFLSDYYIHILQVLRKDTLILTNLKHVWTMLLKACVLERNRK